MKAIINKDNYEAFWVDYLDGKLNPADEERLFAFLESNPEISANLIDAEDFVLPVTEVKFPAKSSLKAEAQIENLLIAKIENEISAEDDKFISEKIKSDKKVATAFLAYQKTIIVPDSSIVFEGKKYLKKATVMPLYRYTAAIAAAFAIVFVSGYLLTKNPVDLSPAVKSQYSFFEIPTHISETLIPEKIEKLLSVNNNETNIYASNNQNEQIENNIANNDRPEVPKRLPHTGIAMAPKQVSSNEYIFMEFRYDVPKDDVAFEYTMQITPAPEQSRLKTAINKIYKFGQDINIMEEFDKLKVAKEELLFTSNQ